MKPTVFERKVKKELTAFKKGKLSTPSIPRVKSSKQAVAIALSEAKKPDRTR
jgi:hypothetical protein